MTDKNPLTKRQRAKIQAQYRGRPLGDGKYRNFCRECGIPMSVGYADADSLNLDCVNCDETPINYTRLHSCGNPNTVKGEHDETRSGTLRAWEDVGDDR